AIITASKALARGASGADPWPSNCIALEEIDLSSHQKGKEPTMYPLLKFLLLMVLLSCGLLFADVVQIGAGQEVTIGNTTVQCNNNGPVDPTVSCYCVQEGAGFEYLLYRVTTNPSTGQS